MSSGARAVAGGVLVGLLVACARFDGTEAATDPSTQTADDAGAGSPSDASGGDAAVALFTCPREAGWVCTTFDEAPTVPPGWTVSAADALAIVSGAGPTPPNQLRVVVPAKNALNARLYHLATRSTPPSAMTFRFEASVVGCRGCEIASVNQYAATGTTPLLSVWVEVDGAGTLQLRSSPGPSVALGPLRDGWHGYELRVTGGTVVAFVDGASAGTVTVSWGASADRIETSVGFWRTAPGGDGEALYDDVAYRIE